MASKKKNKEKEIRQVDKDLENAVTLVKSWVDQTLKDYHPPVRSGVPKGEPIGFSLEKKRAALLMVLHPEGLQLREIGKLAGGVSENVLRVWRTQKDFQEEISRAYELFTEQLINEVAANFWRFRAPISPNAAKAVKELELTSLPSWKIESNASAGRMVFLLASVIRFFNHEIFMAFLRWFEEHMDKNALDTSIFFYSILRSGIEDIKTLRALETNPKILSLNKRIITGYIDLLTIPKNRKGLSDDEMEKKREFLKRFIFEKLDTLAG
jgi:hypothetical protein